MAEFLSAALVLTGAVFAFAAGVGMLRMPDIMIRMHASTKAGTLGVGLILLGVAVHFGELGVVSRAIATILFLLITAPVAAHMIGRAAYRAGVRLWDATIVDEWQGNHRPTSGPPPSTRTSPTEHGTSQRR